MNGHNTMPKAVIYTRVSSEKQVREGHGLDGQESRCRGYASERGYEVVAVFRDEGVSGGTIDRDGMRQMIDFLGRGGDNVVLIDDLKRLARDLVGHFTLRQAIRSTGARLESPSHRFGEEPEERFVESIFAATAELERNQNRRQVCHRMKARLEAGYWPFYPPPGYAIAKVPGHGKMLVLKEPEASIVRQALEGFADGRFATQAEVRQFLDSVGFEPPRQRGRGITHKEQVRRLLAREIYCGIITYPPWNVTPRQGHHRPLISPETYDRVVERLRETGRPKRGDFSEDYPLRGFVLCGGCSKPFTAAWSRGKSGREFAYYRCLSAGCPDQNRSVRAERMHQEFEAILTGLRPRQTLLELIRVELLAEWERRRLDVEGVRQARQEKLQEIERRITSLLDAVAACSSPSVVRRLSEEVEALEAKKLRLGGQIDRQPQRDFAGALGRVLEFLQHPLDEWKNGDLKLKRTLLRLAFDGALVYRRNEGFATPRFSPPLALACVSELDRMELVDTLRRTYNTLEADVLRWLTMPLWRTAAEIVA